MKIYLHKYLSVAALKALITSHSIKLSFGYEANDCFEMLPGDAAPSNGENSVAVAKHGFISLSANHDSPYMWGNYADHYKGARLDLVFEVEDADKQSKRFVRRDKGKPRHKYIRNIDRIEFEGSNIEKCEYEVNRIDKVEKNLEKCTLNIISNKERSWAQEEEYRIIYSISYAGMPNPMLSARAIEKGIIYTTKDINHCIYKIALGPLCEMSVSDVKYGLMSEISTRGIIVEQLKFNECEYRVAWKNRRIAPLELIMGLIREKSMKAVKRMTENNNILNLVDAYGNNCMTYAMRCKSKELVQYFLSKNVDLDELPIDEAYQSLLWCAECEFPLLADKLLKKFSSSKLDEKVDCLGRNALMCAARNGSPETFGVIFQQLNNRYKTDSLDKSEDLISFLNKADNNGCTALMLAAWSKSKEIVNVLIEAGVDVNITDNQNSNALIYAASGSSANDDDENGKDIIIMLKGAKANTNLHEFAGYTALDYAINNGRKKCISNLLHGKATFKSSLVHFCSGDSEIIQHFYSFAGLKRAFEDLSNINNKQPFIASLLFVLEHILTNCPYHTNYFWRRLLEACNSTAQFIPIFAARQGNFAVLQSFKRYLANYRFKQSFYELCFNHGDNAGCNALMWCIANPDDDINVYSNRHECLKFLLNIIKSSDLAHQDESGCTVLIWAARKGDIEAIDLIIKRAKRLRSNIEELLCRPDNLGMTLLMWAAWKRKHKVLSLLFNKYNRYVEPALSLQDNSSRTVMDWACLARDEAVVQVLIKYDLKHSMQKACKFGRLLPFVEDNDI